VRNVPDDCVHHPDAPWNEKREEVTCPECQKTYDIEDVGESGLCYKCSTKYVCAGCGCVDYSETFNQWVQMCQDCMEQIAIEIMDHVAHSARMVH